MKSYLSLNINDLPLFQQFVILATGDISYKNILDNFNFHPDKKEYHNIEYRNLKSNTIYLHDGNKQITEDAKKGIEDIITINRSLLCSIFNRFRIFMSSNLHKILIAELYASLPCCKREYKTLTSVIKHHIYNKRGIKTYPIMPDEGSSFWDCLIKTFELNEVVGYLTRMIEIGVDFDSDLVTIYNTIRKYVKQCDDEQRLLEQKYFDKLLDRIEFLRMKYKNREISSYSCDVDELFGMEIKEPNMIRYFGSLAIVPPIYSKKKKEETA